MIDLAALVVSAVIGFGVGVMSGMLGVGGGSIMVPLFRLGFGLSAIEATATSLFTIIPTSIAGVVQHIRKGTCLVPLGLAAGIGGAITSPVGVHLASMSPGWAIMLATALAIVYTSWMMLRRGLAMPKEGSAQAVKAAGGSDTTVSDAPVLLSGRQLLYGAGIGLVTGVAAGYIGLGGGFIMVPLFVLALGIPIKNASASSLLAIFILAITGVAGHLALGNVEVGIGLALSVGSIPGALVGASLVQRMPERTLRIFFGAFLIVVAIVMVINEFIVAG